jgi:hypothetical protein
MIKLNEFSKDQLQWMLNKATQDMVDISKWQEAVEQYQMVDLMKDMAAEKSKKFNDLKEICVQVLTAMGDVAVRETIASN